MSRRLVLQFDDADTFRREYEQNIAQGGAFVHSSETWSMRDPVEVEIRLAFCGESVQLDAEIVHCVSAEEAGGEENRGVAVQFLIPAPELRERLEPHVPKGTRRSQPTRTSDAPAGGRGLFSRDDEDSLETDDVESPFGENADFDADGGEDDGALESPLEPSGAELRRNPRHEARVPVLLDSTNVSLEGRTRDLSESGVLLSIDGSDVPVGKSVRVSILNPDTGETVEVEGRVARHIEGEGTVAAVGVEFEERPENRDKLEELIEDVSSVERRRREAGISGAIEELGMVNVLQMFANAAQQGTLTLTRGQEEGVVAYEAGDLRYARLGALSGGKALSRLLSWTEGSFEFHAQVDPLTDEEDPVPFDGMLLEAVRQLDEAHRLSSEELVPSARLELDGDAFGESAGELSKTEEAVIDLAAASLTIRRLLDVIPEPDAEILEAVRNLNDRGLIRVYSPKG